MLQRSLDTALFPLIVSHIRKNKDLALKIPRRILDVFEQAQAQIIVKNTFLKVEFEKIIQDFSLLDIDVIPLKGIYLVDSYYSNFTLRQISDIDLLVKEDSLASVCRYFIENGFEMEMYMPALAAKVSKTPAPYKFIRADLVIDLHVGLTYIYDSCRFNMETVWSKSSRFPKGYSIMNSMDHAIYLSAHLIKHFDYRNCKLINFYDILLVIKQDQISVEDLLDYSRLFGFEKDVKDIFYLLKKYFYLSEYIINLPEFEPSRKDIDEVFLEILSNSRVDLEKKYSPEGSTGFKPLLSLSFTNRMRYLFSRVFPDVSYLRMKYRNRKKTDLGKYFFHFKTVLLQVFSSPKIE